MDTADSQHLSRLSKMLLAGIGVAFAWVLLSLALGFTASQAHAAENDGLLGGVTDALSGTTGAVTDVVSGTTTAVTEVVSGTTTAVVVDTVTPVVEVVAPVVPPLPIAPVVEVVESVAAPVLHTVTGVADAGVVAPIVDSALGIVDGVPIVGSVVSELGVSGAVSSVGGSVDGVIRGTTGAVGGTVTGIVDSTDPLVPVLVTPPLPGAPEGIVPLDPDQSSPTPPAALTNAAAGPFETLLRAAYLTGYAAWTSMSTALPASLTSSDAVFVVEDAGGALLSLLRSVVQAESVLMGPGGAGPGAWALLARGFVVAYRAWMRRSGPENDLAPPAPAFSTDVSPD